MGVRRSPGPGTINSKSAASSHDAKQSCIAVATSVLRGCLGMCNPNAALVESYFLSYFYSRLHQGGNTALALFH
jgi:hypothetical protein